MTTYYTCTEVTPEVCDAYLKYKSKGNSYNIKELQAVVLCSKHGEILIYPVSLTLNIRHLREFKRTDWQSYNGDSNTLVSVEEFFNQLFILELDQ